MVYSGPGGSGGLSISEAEATVIASAFTEPYEYDKIRRADLYDDADSAVLAPAFTARNIGTSHRQAEEHVRTAISRVWTHTGARQKTTTTDGRRC